MRGNRPALAQVLDAPTPIVEALEQRLLYSADIAPMLLPAPDGLAAAWVATPLPAAPLIAAPSGTEQATHAAVQSRTLTEIVFIDSTVPDADRLLADLRQQAEQGRPLEVVVIQAGEDGLARIGDVLAGRQGIGALHLIGHGQAGQMQLGGTLLDHDTLMARAAEIAQWQSALDADADLLLYGCEVGSTLNGQQLVEGLAALTGADVAANADATGAATQGGDWTLEVRQGQIDTAVVFNAATQTDWQGLLATAMPSAKGGAVYNDDATTQPQAGNWDGFSLGATGSTAVTANWTVITSAQSATRDEAIVVGVDEDGVVRGQMWNGSTWTALPQNPMSTSSVSDRQGFAVGYEQQSGDALLVWASGSRLYYSTWNGTVWSATSSVDVGSDAIERIQIAHRPGSDQMVIAVSDSEDDKYAAIWNGTQFGNVVALDTQGSDSRDQLALAVAYESTSGTAMVAYGKHNDPGVYYKLFNGFSWSSEFSAGNFGSTGSTLALSLSSDPGSDRLVMSQTILVQHSITSYSSYSAFGIWDGNSWGYRTVPGYSSFPAQTGGITADAVFESRSGEVLAVYQAGDNNLRYLTWSSGGGWSGAVTGPAMGGTQTTMRLFADPTSDHVMLGSITSNKAVSFTQWDGSAWGTRQQLAANSGATSTPAFTWVWRQAASQPATSPTLWLGAAGPDANGWTGVNAVNGNQVLAVSDPNLSFGNGNTGGTFSHVFDSSAWGANGLDDIVRVSSTVVMSPSITVQRGDLLFTTSATSTLSSLNNITVNNNDVVLFRPAVEGDYSRGTFTVLFTALGGGDDVRGLALVEKSTVVGDTTLTVGSLLYTVGNGNGNARDIQWFIPHYVLPVVGLVVNVTTTLVNGAELGINKAITGLELVSTTTTIKNATLTAGQLLISLADTSTVANTSGIQASDVVALTLTQTSVNGTAQGSSAVLLRGNALGMSGAIDSLALYTPIGTSAPVITGATAFIVPELTTADITTVTASDADGNTLTYSLVGGADQARFVIDAGTGVLRFVAPPDGVPPGDADQDNVYEVTVRASDGTYAQDRGFTVLVQPYNRAPVNTLPLAATIAEDSALSLAGLQVGDSDAGTAPLKVTLSVQHGTLSILDDMAGGLVSADIAYAIDRRSVVLTGSQAAINATLADINGALYLADAHYHGTDTLTVTTDDQGHAGLPGATPSLSDTDSITITVTPVNDAPEITSNGGGDTASVTVPEFSTTPVATLTATDVDNATLSYSIAGGADQALFTIDASTGVLRFVSPPDSTAALSYTVVVRASDGSLHDDQTLTVTLQPINRAPINAMPGALSITEDGTLALVGLSVQDTDAGSHPIRVTLQVDHGTLSVLDSVTGGLSSAGITLSSDGRRVVLFGSQAAINTTLQATGGVLYRPDADYAGSDSLTMTSNDQGHSGLPGATPALDDVDTVAITVTPVTDAPLLTLSTVSGQEDQPTALNLQVVIGDTDNSGGQNERITGVTIAGLPLDATFTNTAGDALLASGGVLSLTPGQWLGLTMHLPPNASGSWALTVTATAQDGSAAPTSTQASWTVVVAPVNDAPVLTSNGGGSTASISVPEFTTAPVTTVTASDIDNAFLAYSIVGGADQARFTIDAATGVLRFVSPPDTDLASTYTVVVRASDGSLHAQQTLTVDVQHLNRAPVNTVPGAQQTDEDTALAITGLQVIDSDAGSLPITVTLQVQHGTLSIAAGIGGGLGTSDILYATDRRSVTLTGSQTAINATLQAAQGVVYQADLDYAGNDILTMTSNDQGHAGTSPSSTVLSDQDTVALTVRPVTDAPALTLGAASGLEDQPIALNLQAVVGDTDNSGDQNERLTGLTISGIPDGARFNNTAGDTLTALDGVLLLAPGQWLGLTMTPPPDAHGTWTLVVQATAQDAGAAPASTQAGWVVTAQAVDDAPVVSQHSLAIQQGGKAVVDLRVLDVDTPQDQLQIQVLTASNGHFERAATGEVVTQFSLEALQSGAVRFAHDGSNQAPAYALALRDGSNTVTVTGSDIRFTATPPVLTGPDTPTTPDTPAPEQPPASSSGEAATEDTPPATASQVSEAASAGASSPNNGGDPDALPPSLDGLLRQAEVRVLLGAAPQFVLDLAPRETPNYAAAPAINIDASYTWLGSLQTSGDYADELRRNLETLQQQLKEQGLERREVIASSIALTTGLSVGYVIWLVRGGALLGSMLSAMPAWAMIDPMPVLARARSQAGQGAADDGDETVEDLFEDQDAPIAPPAPEPIRPASTTQEGLAFGAAQPGARPS